MSFEGFVVLFGICGLLLVIVWAIISVIVNRFKRNKYSFSNSYSFSRSGSMSPSATESCSVSPSASPSASPSPSPEIPE
jgi:hypothetical protein